MKPEHQRALKRTAYIAAVVALAILLSIPLARATGETSIIRFVHETSGYNSKQWWLPLTALLSTLLFAAQMSIQRKRMPNLTQAIELLGLTLSTTLMAYANGLPAILTRAGVVLFSGFCAYAFYHTYLKTCPVCGSLKGRRVNSPIKTYECEVCLAGWD